MKRPPDEKERICRSKDCEKLGEYQPLKDFGMYKYKGQIRYRLVCKDCMKRIDRMRKHQMYPLTIKKPNPVTGMKRKEILGGVVDAEPFAQFLNEISKTRAIRGLALSIGIDESRLRRFKNRHQDHKRVTLEFVDRVAVECGYHLNDIYPDY